MTEHNYYKRGTRDNIIISNSAMSSLNPEEGGSPQKFLSFFDENKEQKSTRSLNNGKVVHAYIEDKESFIIDDLDRPSESICIWVEEILRMIEAGEEGEEVIDLEKKYTCYIIRFW